MKKQTPVIQKSTKSQFAWRRLGFLQLSLIMHLRQKEMYGVEIREHLALDGYVVDDNQIYQPGALNSFVITELFNEYFCDMYFENNDNYK